MPFHDDRRPLGDGPSRPLTLHVHGHCRARRVIYTYNAHYLQLVIDTYNTHYLQLVIYTYNADPMLKKTTLRR